MVESGRWTGWTTEGIGSIDSGRLGLVPSTTDFSIKPKVLFPTVIGSMSVKVVQYPEKRQCWVATQPNNEHIVEVAPDGRVHLMDGHGGELAHTEPLELDQWQYIEFNQIERTITVTPGMGPRYGA